MKISVKDNFPEVCDEPAWMIIDTNFIFLREKIIKVTEDTP